jgi:hypothetical protein
MMRKYFWALLATATLLATVLFAPPASAMGAYRLRSNEVQEAGGSWHIYMSIDLPSKPSIPHVPMKFIFTKTTEYERALTDNSKDPVMNRIPIQNALPQTESLDVDFADGSGKIFKNTRYDFSLTRTRGFVAGEYKMQVRTSDGTDVGAATNIILKGDNPVVDRRSISFQAPKPKDHKDTKVAQNDTAAVPTSTEVTPSGSAPPFVPPDAYQKTEEEEAVQGKPGGCGCSVPGLSGTSQAALAGLVAGLGLLAFARRRRRAA